MNQISYAVQLANILFQCALVVLLLVNFAREYIILLAYSFAYLIATVSGEYLLRRDGFQSAAYRIFYWRAEVGLDLLLFLTVIILIYQALEGSPVRRSAGPLLAGIVAVALILPFLVSKGRVLSSRWFEGASQILNFSAAILNLGLWTALLLRKKRDPRLLEISVGVGVTVTGAAISYGFLQLLASGRDFINFFSAVTHTAGVLLWCRAFVPRSKARETSRAANSASMHVERLESSRDLYR